MNSLYHGDNLGKCFSISVLAVIAVAAAPVAAQPTYITFDVPGAASTWPLGINDTGEITGYYQDAINANHGFVRAADGTINKFDPPGSISTLARKLNSAGTITGDYLDANSISHAFVRAANGKITSFDPPASIHTVAYGINDSGTITGSYGTANHPSQGYLRAADGAITSFDVPGSNDTEGAGINSDGVITGPYCTGAQGPCYGYIRAPSGTISTFSYGSGVTITPVAINSTGIITGSICFPYDCDKVIDSFVRGKHGDIKVFHVDKFITEASNLNDRGEIIGLYGDRLTSRGFLRRMDEGKIRPLIPPGSTQGLVEAINNLGQIVGTYEDDNGVYHGFLRTR